MPMASENRPFVLFEKKEIVKYNFCKTDTFS